MFVISDRHDGSTRQAYAHISYDEKDEGRREAYLVDGKHAAPIAQIITHKKVSNLVIHIDMIGIEELHDELPKKYRWVNAENYKPIMLSTNERGKELLRKQMPW